MVTVLVTAQALAASVPPDLHTSRVPPRSALHFGLLGAHIVTAAVAVLTGLAQSWPWLRRRHPAAHRWTGRAYFFAGVFPSALVGIPVIHFTPWASATRRPWRSSTPCGCSPASPATAPPGSAATPTTGCG